MNSDNWFMSCHEYAKLYKRDELEEKYKSSINGVGFIMIGTPTDYDKFIDVLEDHSCPPIMSRQILDDLIHCGQRKTTLMARLRFDIIETELSRLGVHCMMTNPIDINKSKQRLKLNAAHVAFKKLIQDENVNDEIKDNEFTETYINLGKLLFKRYGSKINGKWK